MPVVESPSSSSSSPSTAAELSSLCCPPGSHEAPPSALNSELFDDDGTSALKGAMVELVTAAGRKLSCYYTGPAMTTDNGSSNNDNDNDSAVLGIVVYYDVWGFDPRSRIKSLCDCIAAQLGGKRSNNNSNNNNVNVHVIVPDVFRGQTVENHNYGDRDDSYAAWIRSMPYNAANVGGDTLACVDYLRRTKGVPLTNFAAIGFCWGAWAIGKSCQNNDVPSWKSVVGIHPSFKPECYAFGGNDPESQIELLRRTVSVCPLLLLVAPDDADFLKPGSSELLELLDGNNDENENNKSKKKKRSAVVQSVLFPDMKHGWTTRGDITNDETVARDVRRALRETVDFLRTHAMTAVDDNDGDDAATSE